MPTNLPFRLLPALLLCMLGIASASEAPPPAQTNIPVGRVVVSGTVPDEATHAVILTKLQELYGTGQIVDQMTVGGVIAPPNWTTSIPKLISQDLKSISKGQVAIDGTTVSMHGEVASEAVKQSIASNFANALNANYTIKNGLRVTAASQTVLDQTLANRVIEFENGSALLTPSGMRILDEMSNALKKVNAKRIDVIGHTDDIGSRTRNMALSTARADSVKIYLVSKGLPADLITTTGMGPDQPIMSNATSEGRRRNRRIEFRVSQ